MQHLSQAIHIPFFHPASVGCAKHTKSKTLGTFSGNELKFFYALKSESFFLIWFLLPICRQSYQRKWVGFKYLSGTFTQ